MSATTLVRLSNFPRVKGVRFEPVAVTGADVSDEPLIGTIAWRLDQVEGQVRTLEGKFDRLTLAIVVGSITVSCSLVVAALTLIAE